MLAGDHCQLPPTVVSREATERRLWRQPVRTADRRALRPAHHAAADGAVSHAPGDHGVLVARVLRRRASRRRERAEPHCCATCRAWLPTPLTESPIEFIDTAGAGYDEELEPDGESRLNPQEAELVVTARCNELLEAGVPRETIAVIAPYAAQVRLLRESLAVPELEIDSVDGFQGREKEAVVISLVRSNADGEIGFLADVRRMNVALTRARRKLLVIGDSATLSGDDFIAG